jgi:hypothetical protein
VQKNAALLDQPLALWDRAFEVFPRLGPAICASGWAQSMLGEVFEPVVRRAVATLYPGPAQVADLCEEGWETASAPFAVWQAPPEHQETWRRMNDRDLQRALGVLGVLESLGAAEPPVWRRLLVPPTVRLDRLHRIIQQAMGWEDYHLHVFTAGGARYGDPDRELGQRDESRVALADLAARPGAGFRYTYDFGDNWEYAVVVEEVLTAVERTSYPRCVDGAGACPPEDCGGVGGYQRLREVLADPDDGEHQDMVEWLGLAEAAEFDPHRFDPDEVNRALARAG